MRQPLEALKVANEVKAKRRKLRAGLLSGELSPAEVLADPAMQGLRLTRFFGWLPRCGPHRARTRLRRAGISEYALERPIRSLTERQRRALASEVRL